MDGEIRLGVMPRALSIGTATGTEAMALQTDGAGLKHCFEPVGDSESRVMILGSLPGEASLRAQQYYANPRNQFWRLIGDVLETDLVSLSYADRLEMCLRRHIALWDVVARGERAGSLDSGIRNHASNDIATLAMQMPRLRVIAFNGGKAARIGRASLGARTEWTLIDLPSSSPAHTIAYDAKRAHWMALRRFLDRKTLRWT